MPDFLDIDRVEANALREILRTARARKDARAGWSAGHPDADAPLDGTLLALLFERPSTRTRVSFDVAIRQLGGTSLVLNAPETHLGRSERISDTGAVLSRYVDAVAIRAQTQERLEAFTAKASVPVINGLTDRTHPCQIMADLMTIEEQLGNIGGRVLCWCGDGNNVLHSFLQAAPKWGFRLRAACPPGHAPDAGIVAQARAEGGEIELMQDPAEAIQGADVVVTDAWASMGDDDAGSARRRAVFRPYQVDATLLAQAADHAIFLHCLPAYRGEEVTDEVLDGPHSRVLDEAENRLHVQKAILLWCLGR